MATLKNFYNLFKSLAKIHTKKKEAKRKTSLGTKVLKIPVPRPLKPTIQTTLNNRRIKAIKGLSPMKKKAIQRVIQKQLPVIKRGFGPKAGIYPITPTQPKGGGGGGMGGRTIHTRPDPIGHVPAGYQFVKPTGPLTYERKDAMPIPVGQLDVKLRPPTWNSSAIWEIGYNPIKKILVILFNSGDAYKYEGVPLRDAQNLNDGISAAQTEGYNKYGAYYRGKSPSVGAAYNYIIKPKGNGQLLFSMAARA